MTVPREERSKKVEKGETIYVVIGLGTYVSGDKISECDLPASLVARETIHPSTLRSIPIAQPDVMQLLLKPHLHATI